MIDFDAEILDHRGKPFDAGEGDEGTLRLKHVCERALLAPIPAEQARDLPTPAARFKLWHVIWNGGQKELTAEQVGLLKKVVAAAFPAPIIVGRALVLLDPAEGA